MTTRGRACFLLAAIVAMTLSLPTLAADAAPKWDPANTKAPASVEELKALQATVKSMVDKVTPAVVAVQYGAGAGSGVIVSEDGLVLTAAHVVTPMPLDFGGGGRRRPPADDTPPPKNCSLMLPDGKYVTAVVLGRNKGMDSAILKITGKVPEGAKWAGADKGKWPYVELGKSADAKLGQWVVALGHPGGPKKDRRPPVRLGQLDEIWTSGSRIVSDCTLVGGDSGGPLFDLDGKLLGIHSSIGGELSKNYHVPTKMFQRDWDQMVRGDNIGMRSDAYMGISWTHDKDADKFIPTILETTAGSPAADAGLLAGDKVIRLNGAKIETVQDVDNVMTGLRAGQRVEIHVKRGEDVYELEMTLASRKKLTAPPKTAAELKAEADKLKKELEEKEKKDKEEKEKKKP